MERLFGTFGIRGVANKDLTAKVAFKLGLALSTHLDGYGKVAVGYDPRTSSVMLEHAIISGLTAGGCDAVKFGMVPTPVLSYGIPHFDCDAGVMITASHNPPEYNGIKFWDEEGAGFVRSREKEIERIFDEGEKPVSWKKIGEEIKVDALTLYKKSLIDRVLEIDGKLKVVIDCANGAGSVVTPVVLSELGCDVVDMNSQPDGTFPGHLPEPTAEHLGELMKMIASTGADIGIAHDGDGDRTMVVNEKGALLSGDRTFALATLHHLEGTKKPRIVTTVATSSVIDDVAEKLGGDVVRTKVGEPEVIQGIRKKGGDIGGEENGGVIFPDWSLCRDGIMTAVQIVDYLAGAHLPVSEADKSLPQYWQIKRRTECPDELKPAVLQLLGEKFDRYELDRTDGLRVVLDDGWFIVRPSGTEPLFRCFSEAKGRERAEELAEEGIQSIEESIELAKKSK